MRRGLVLVGLTVACGGPASTDFGAVEDSDAVTDTVPAVGDTEDPAVVDADEDGFPVADDCDDADPLVHPAAPERCGGGVDEDCDRVVDRDDVPLAGAAFVGPLYRDLDGDGWGDEHTETWFCLDPGDGWVGKLGDCEDLDPEVFPEGPTGCPEPAGRCGDAILEPGERCDDGDTTPGDGCNATCRREHCGDGVRQDALGERCDDGNTVAGDGCGGSCLPEGCGDGVLQIALGEGCDDGGTAAGDGCGPDCLSETCGDEVVQPEHGEACDDGGIEPGDDCSPGCRFEGCGDGVLTDGERCDDGDRDDGDGCTAGCRLERFRLLPLAAEVSPTEITSGDPWDYLDPDKPADAFLLVRVDGVFVFRTPVVPNDNAPVFTGSYLVTVPPGSVLELQLADLDATTEPDLIGTWTLDHGTLNARVGEVMDLDGPMVETLTLRVAAP